MSDFTNLTAEKLDELLKKIADEKGVGEVAIANLPAELVDRIKAGPTNWTLEVAPEPSREAEPIMLTGGCSLAEAKDSARSEAEDQAASWESECEANGDETPDTAPYWCRISHPNIDEPFADFTVNIDPSEPECEKDEDGNPQEHDWDESGPRGGNRGGITYKSKCRHCGLVRTRTSLPRYTANPGESEESITYSRD